MKKTIAFILTFAILAAILSINVSAADYNIPKAMTAPVLDGVINADEWANAFVRDLRPGSGIELWDAYGSGFGTYQGSVFYYMWTDAGLYVAADVKMDMATFETPVRGEANYVAGSFQLCIWAQDDDAMKLWLTLHTKADDGSPVITNANVGMDDVPGITMGVQIGTDGYTAEALIGIEAFADVGINIAEGTQIGILTDTIYWDTAADTVECACDSVNWSAEHFYTFTSAAAGKDPNAAPPAAEPEPAPAEDVPAAEPDAPVVDEPAPSRPASPASGNIGFVLIVFSAVIAAGAFVVLRKKSLGGI